LQDICIRLGKLFSEFQSYPYILNTPESASLSINDDLIGDDLEDIIRIGEASGWLMVRYDRGKTWIGLHPILSPKFQISFRYPFYYPESLSDRNMINELFFGTDSQYRKCKQKILENRKNRYQKRTGNVKQRKLFK
jgi:hypothetical protein